MKEIGQILREARERKGLSIEQVSEQTRIRPTYLNAIEAGDFAKLPGAVYIRGFLKSFATVVEVDSSGILEMYNKHEQQHPGEVGQEISEVKLSRTKPTIHVGKIIMACLVLGGLVVGGVFVFRFWSILKNETIPQLRDPEPQVDQISGSEGGGDQTTPDQTNTGTENQSTDAAGGGNPDTSATTPDPSGAQQSAGGDAVPAISVTTPESELPVDPQQVEPTAQTRIQIIAIQQSWVRVMVDNQVMFADMMNLGETKTYEGEIIHLRIGNAAGIQVNYNGQISGPFGTEGKVVDRVFGE